MIEIAAAAGAGAGSEVAAAGTASVMLAASTGTIEIAAWGARLTNSRSSRRKSLLPVCNYLCQSAFDIISKMG